MFLVLVGLAIGLLPATSAAQAPRRTVRGDTTIVAAEGSGVWGNATAVKEVLRVGGASGKIEFGNVLSVAALPDGGVAVLDAASPTGPAIMLIDSTGHLRKTLGRQGAGPGEFGVPRSYQELSLLPDGVLALLDHTNARIDRWRLDGSLLSAIPLPAGTTDFGFLPHLLPGPDGTIYLHTRVPGAMKPTELPASHLGYVRLRMDGTLLDTIPPPTPYFGSGVPDAYGPMDFWRPLSDGRILQGRTDRLGFTLAGGTHRGVTAVIRSASAVLVLPEERAEWDALQEWMIKRNPAAASVNHAMARSKAIVSATSLDLNGRIWFQLHSKAVAGVSVAFPGQTQDVPPPLRYFEPPAFAVFKLDGTFLGRIDIALGDLHPVSPLSQYLVDTNGRWMWGVLLDREDNPVLVKWRLPADR